MRSFDSIIKHTNNINKEIKFRVDKLLMECKERYILISYNYLVKENGIIEIHLYNVSNDKLEVLENTLKYNKCTYKNIYDTAKLHYILDIALHGCDDSTYISHLNVNKIEHDFIVKLCKLSELSRTYSCMPIMSIENKRLEIED